MPHVIHHPARIIPAYDETYFDLNELNDDARARAIDDWRKESAEFSFSLVCDEVSRSLDYVLEQLPTRPRVSYDKGGNLYLSISEADAETSHWRRDMLGRVNDDGVCYGIDFADAYNAHADAIDRLADAKYNLDVFSDEYNEAIAALCDEVNAALDAIARMYNEAIDAEYDYYFYGEAAETFGLDGYVFDDEGNAYLAADVLTAC